MLVFPTKISDTIKYMGVRVPSAKIGGYIMPIGDLKLKGTTIPKNNQNKVGQNASENIKPIKNDGLNILNSPLVKSLMMN